MGQVKSMTEGRKRGVTFNYGDCNNLYLNAALEKLDEQAGIFDVKDLTRFMKIKNQFNQKQEEVKKLYSKIVRKHSHLEPMKDPNDPKKLFKNKAGKTPMIPVMKPDKRGQMMYDLKDEKGFDSDIKELFTETFTIEAYQLELASFIKAGLNPKEIRSCAKMISDIDPELLDDPVESDEFLEAVDEDTEYYDDPADHEDIEGASFDPTTDAPPPGGIELAQDGNRPKSLERRT